MSAPASPTGWCVPRDPAGPGQKQDDPPRLAHRRTGEVQVYSITSRFTEKVPGTDIVAEWDDGHCPVCTTTTTTTTTNHPIGATR